MNLSHERGAIFNKVLLSSYNVPNVMLCHRDKTVKSSTALTVHLVRQA